MTKQYTSDPKGRKFLSAAAFLLTLVIIFALNILRQYVKEKFPQYLPDTTSLPEKLIIVLMIILRRYMWCLSLFSCQCGTKPYGTL